MISIVTPAWMDRALCAQTDPEAYFPTNDGEHFGWNNATRAVAVCQRCPVTAKCLAYALDNEETWGIWGGPLPAERRRLKRSAS